MSPRRYAATLIFSLRSRHLRGGYTSSGGLAAFSRAVVIVDGMREHQGRGDPVTHIHSHFAHDPTLLGLIAHRLSGLPFSFTAHARDLYQIPAPALIGRTREASAIVTCCQANVDYIDRVTGGVGSRVHLIYHGADLGLFQPALGLNDFPDFVAYARSYGAQGHRPSSADEFAPTLQRCLDTPGVHLIDVPIEKDA